LIKRLLLFPISIPLVPARRQRILSRNPLDQIWLTTILRTAMSKNKQNVRQSKLGEVFSKSIKKAAPNIDLDEVWK
jgi:hypothetical protein